MCDKEFIKLSNGIILQRLNRDFLWYAIKDNKIIDFSKYRHDLEEKHNDKTL